MVVRGGKMKTDLKPLDAGDEPNSRDLSIQSGLAPGGHVSLYDIKGQIPDKYIQTMTQRHDNFSYLTYQLPEYMRDKVVSAYKSFKKQVKERNKVYEKDIKNLENIIAYYIEFIDLEDKLIEKEEQVCGKFNSVRDDKLREWIKGNYTGSLEYRKRFKEAVESDSILYSRLEKVNSDFGFTSNDIGVAIEALYTNLSMAPEAPLSKEDFIKEVLKEGMVLQTGEFPVIHKRKELPVIPVKKEKEEEHPLRKKLFALGITVSTISVGTVAVIGQTIENDWSHYFKNPGHLAQLGGAYFGGHVDDIDNDGLPNSWEVRNGMDKYNASDAKIDTDGDDLTNFGEYNEGTNPNLVSTVGDSIPDGWKVRNGFDPLDRNVSGADPDIDGLSNLREYEEGTGPRNNDSDSDSLNDGKEIFVGTDPLEKDTDSDGLLDGKEVSIGTNPLKKDTDDDGMGDEFEVYAQNLWKNTSYRPYNPIRYNQRHGIFIYNPAFSDTYLHKTLIERYDFRPENVKYISQRNITSENFRKIMNNISSSVGNEGLVFLGFNTHGDGSGVGFKDRYMKYEELDELLGEIESPVVTIFDQCYSGAAAQKMNNPVVYTQTGENETGWSGRLHTFISLALGSGRGHIININGNFTQPESLPIVVDKEFGNDDGRISIKEAFDFSKYMFDNLSKHNTNSLEKDAKKMGQYIFPGDFKIKKDEL